MTTQKPNIDPDLWASLWVTNNGIHRVWLYDPQNGGHHWWDDKRWEPFPVPRVARLYIWGNVMDTTLEASTRDELNDQKGAILDAIDRQITRRLPLRIYDGNQTMAMIALANGVWSFDENYLMEFDPDRDIHRQVTGGQYREEWTDDGCFATLHNRFNPSGVSLLDDEGIWHLVDIVGLALTGRAQQHRPICFLYGTSGGGKGGTQRLVRETLGGRAAAVSKDWLNRRANDIDATTTSILLNQPLVVTISESRSIDQDRLLALTGDDGWTARYPHGLPVTGDIPCLVMISTTTPPDLDINSGFGRRVCMLHFPKADGIRPEDVRHPHQDEKDALITLAIRHGKAVFMLGYEPPRGHADILAEFIASADAFATWVTGLNEQGILSGLAIKQLTPMWTAEGNAPMTPNQVAKRVREMGYGTHSLRDRAGSLTFVTVGEDNPTEERVQEWINRARIVSLMPS